MKGSVEVVDAGELSRIMESGEPPVLVDTRLEEDFERGHLPGAVSNCVLEVECVERMPDLVPDRALPVCVYGTGCGSFDSELAAEKLRRLGYERVLDFRGGVAAWKAGGFQLEGGDGELPAETPPEDGEYPVDLEESRVRWIGRNLLSFHEGTLRIASGSLRIESGRLAGGGFVIDMKSMLCVDLHGTDLHDILIRHLKDLDFFDVGKFPEARFEIDRAEEIDGAKPGSPNLHVKGTLTLRGVSAPLEFDACTGVTPEGKLAAQAAFAFDRTLWGVRYGSGKWFSNLAGHLVNDLVEVQLRVVAG
jgi:polyisoprenoid-binding protein YceI/rhodanese-related sulfurtransferase